MYYAAIVVIAMPNHEVPCQVLLFCSYQLHYSDCHRNTCSICRRVFTTMHLLDLHVLEWHDVMFELLAQKRNMVYVYEGNMPPNILYIYFSSVVLYALHQFVVIKCMYF